jgi:hypothetical protein
MDVDVDIMGATEGMMMSIVSHTSSLLAAIELVRKSQSADYSIHSTTVGAS